MFELKGFYGERVMVIGYTANMNLKKNLCMPGE